MGGSKVVTGQEENQEDQEDWQGANQEDQEVGHSSGAPAEGPQERGMHACVLTAFYNCRLDRIAQT